MSKPDGGSAFPGPANSLTDMDGNEANHPGMTLRDYFAAAALQKILPWDWSGDTSGFPTYAENIAKSAYAVADAMLAERSK